MFLARIERQYGRARRVGDGSRYPYGRCNWRKYAAVTRRCSIWWERRKGGSRGLRSSSWPSLGRKPGRGVSVKLLAEDDELYVYAERRSRHSKERAMRRRQLKWLWKRL